MIKNFIDALATFFQVAPILVELWKKLSSWRKKGLGMSPREIGFLLGVLACMKLRKPNSVGMRELLLDFVRDVMKSKNIQGHIKKIPAFSLGRTVGGIHGHETDEAIEQKIVTFINEIRDL